MCSRPERGAGGSRARIAGLRIARTRPVDERVDAAAAGALVVERERTRAAASPLALRRHRHQLPGSARGVTLPRHGSAGAASTARWRARSPRRSGRPSSRSTSGSSDRTTTTSSCSASSSRATRVAGRRPGAPRGQRRRLRRRLRPAAAVHPRARRSGRRRRRRWPSTSPSGRSAAGGPLPPRARRLTPLAGNRRAFAQATWRHLLFGVVLGELERRLNAEGQASRRAVPVSSNGHGNIEHAPSARPSPRQRRRSDSNPRTSSLASEVLCQLSAGAATRVRCPRRIASRLPGIEDSDRPAASTLSQHRAGPSIRGTQTTRRGWAQT